MSRMILLLIATLLLAMPFSDVIAQKKAAPKAKSGVSEVLGTLDWGVTLTEVLDAAKLRLTREWKGKLKTLDTLGIDRLRRQKANEFDALKKSLRRLDGRRTGYESSVIGDEILARKNEAVLKQIIAGQTRFYFFRDERLWKIAVVFDASRSKGFRSFVKVLRSGLGKPTGYGYRKQGRKKLTVSATWKDKLTIAHARDLRTFFSAYLVRFVQVGRGEEIQKERASVGTTVAAKPKDALLGDLFDPKAGGQDGAADDLVDSITGSKHEVDLSKGRPKYASPTPQFQDDPVESKKRKAKGKKATKKKSVPSTPPVSKPSKIVY